MTADTKGNSSAQPVVANGSKYLFPTTFAQQRLWFLEQLQPGSTSYLVPWAIRLSGKLDPAALGRSLKEIIRRHEVFRTTFSLRDGAPVQVVASSLSFAMPFVDLSADPERERKVEAIAREEGLRPMNLEEGPLLRSTLLKVAEEDHVLLLTTHHIIFDAWSRRILVRELADLYQTISAGLPSPLAEPKLQYADYAVWLRKYFEAGNLEKQLSYWKKQLAGIPAALEFPTDRSRSRGQTFQGKAYRFSFSPEFSQNLNKFSRSHGVTLFMTLLAGFQALLARYSGQEDIVIGSPIANRNRAEIEELIGLFANTLVLRAKLADDPTFREILSQAKETALGAFAHQDMPFERLVEELNPERSLNQNPLFQVVFSLQNVPKLEFELAGLELKFIDRGQTSAKFDLSLFLTEGPEGIYGRVEYNTDLFNPSTIERMIGHYRVLLGAAVTNPELKLAQLPLLTPAERQQVLVDWNATDAEIPRQPVHELVEAQVHRTPDAVAVVHGERELTYGELNAGADQLAQHLQVFGVEAGDRVAILLERSIALVVAELAVLKCGAAYVPVDPAFPAERKAFMITDCGARVLLSTRSMEVPQSRAATRIHMEDIPLNAVAKGRLKVAVEPESTAYVMYTSGSTGQPKGVLVPHRAISRLVLNNGYARFEPTDRVAFASNPAFDATTLEVWAPLLNGGRIVVLDQSTILDPAAFGRALIRNRVTVLWLTVGLFNEYADVLSNEFRSLRYLMTGGDALDPKVIARVLHRSPPQHLLNGYGPTETTTFATTHEIHEVPENARSIPIGRPIGNTRIYIFDRHRQPVPIGVTGELYIAGTGVAQGYLNRLDLTAERFVEDPFANEPGARMYKTGDLGRWLDDGTIEFLGRNDFQIKLRGYRIELGEIEAAIKKHPSVQDCVVIVREEAPGNKRLTAYFILKPKHIGDALDLRVWVKGSLPDYMVPAAFVELDKFPLSSNGKIDRKALPKPELSAASSTVVPPRDELEAKLLKIWQKILKLDTFGVTDNFFDLGGHSLTAVRLMSEIKNQTGQEIPLAALFQGATVEYLAQILKNNESVPETLVHQIQSGGSQPPLFAAVVPGVSALGYIPLAKHLGPDQPFYALQRPGPGPHAYRRPYTRKEYEGVASEYIQAMRTIQPKGPYYLAGICEGAHIAFEMVHQLEAAGQKVNLLAIFDTWVLENTQKRGLWSLYYYSQRLNQLKGQPWRSIADFLAGVARKRFRFWAGSRPAPVKSEWIEAYWPGKDFVPHRVQCPITIFKAPKQPFYYHKDELMGWGSRTGSEVEIEVIPHGRHRLMLREPHVRELATALSRVLARLHLGPPEPVSMESRERESADAAAVSR